MDAQKILVERGIKTTKALGQYFLVDESVAMRMVKYAGVECGDVVLEIGAGVGSLTEKLERKAKKVYAVEKDEELCEVLRERCNGSKVEVLEGDFMEIRLPTFNKVVASIPFSLSSPLTYKLLLHNGGFGFAVVLYQREFAQKMSANPGSRLYGRLSVITQALAGIEILEFVHRDAFYPSSPVTAAIVRLRLREKEVVDKEKFFKFVTAAFGQRRKKMSSIFKRKKFFGGSALAELAKRPEELTAGEFVKIGNMYAILGEESNTQHHPEGVAHGKVQAQ